MTEILALLLTLLIPAMALSWLSCWRANVRLSRRLDRALRVVSAAEDERTDGACTSCLGEDGEHRSRCDVVRLLDLQDTGRRAA